MTIGTNIRNMREARGLTLNELAAMIESDVGNLSRLERGKQGYSDAMINKLAAAFGVPLSALFEGMASANVLPMRLADEVSRSQVSALHPDDSLPEEVVYVPESRIEFAAGDGRAVHIELTEDEEPATYRLSWFQKYGINPAKVRRFRVSGDSMIPFMYPRDTILVNTEEINVVDGKVYAIRYGDDLRVKYLSRRLDGTLVLRSVNPAYPDEIIPPEVVQEHISIIGRVRDRSGTGGL